MIAISHIHLNVSGFCWTSADITYLRFKYLFLFYLIYLGGKSNQNERLDPEVDFESTNIIEDQYSDRVRNWNQARVVSLTSLFVCSEHM